eukprot:symbB.v1.2.019515.t1/scaffold1454.1/size117754/1
MVEYLPIDFANRCNVGYCFINFRTSHARQQFSSKFDGVQAQQCLPGFNSYKVCQVTKAKWQGRDENVRRIRSGPELMQQLVQILQLVLAPNLKSSWKPVSPDAPVRPLEPASEMEEPHFSPSSRVNAKGLPADQFEQILQQRDAQLANLLEDWMGRITLLLQSSLDGERRSSRRSSKPPVIPGTSPTPMVQDGPSVESHNSGNSNANSNENPTNGPRRKSVGKVTVRVRTAETLKTDGEGNEEEEEGGSGSMSSLAFLREKGVLCIGSFDKQKEESWLRFFRRKVELLVTSWFFEAFFATIIVTNSIFIAVQVEVASMDPGAEMAPGFFVFASIYTFFFTFELILRIFAKGVKIFCGDDWGWMLLASW